MKESKMTNSMITRFNAKLNHEVEFGLSIDLEKQAKKWGKPDDENIKIWFLKQLKNEEFMRELLLPGIMIMLYNNGGIDKSKLKVLDYDVFYEKNEDKPLFNAKDYLIEI